MGEDEIQEFVTGMSVEEGNLRSVIGIRYSVVCGR